MSKLKLIFFSVFIALSWNGFSQIEWVNIEEAYALSQSTNKKVIIDVYTDWCGWCKRMDATTFHDTEIIRLINDNFIAVKLDGEDRNNIIIDGVTFKFISSGRRGYNEYAAKLLRGRLSYPSIVFLDEDFNLIQPIPGYQKPDALKLIIEYFSGDFHKKMSWEKFKRAYSE